MSSLSNTTDNSIENKNGYQLKKVKIADNDQTVNEPRPTEKTTDHPRKIINLLITSPSLEELIATDRLSWWDSTNTKENVQNITNVNTVLSSGSHNFLTKSKSKRRSKRQN